MTSHEARLNPGTPHSARIWNYWVGGKDNYEADRNAGDAYARAYPGIVDIARASRAFLTRAVAYLAGEEGLRQFLDVGTGLPTVNNTHEVAQHIAPETRIVYVDNDPLVLAHARALLTSTPEGACDYIDADLREPERILDLAKATLDFAQPIALMLLGILGHVQDYTEACAIVRRLVAALAPGSYLVVNDGTNTDPHRVRAAEQHNERGAAVYVVRSPSEIGAYFEGLEPVEPGVVSTSLWRPPRNGFAAPRAVDAYCGVGRKKAAVNSIPRPSGALLAREA